MVVPKITGEARIRFQTVNTEAVEGERKCIVFGMEDVDATSKVYGYPYIHDTKVGYSGT